MKLLNLSSIAPAERVVSINGTQYPIVAQSLASVLRAVQRDKANSEHQDVAKIFEGMIESAADMIPSCPREELMTLTPAQLSSLISFASGSDDDAEEVVDAELGDGEKKKGK
jgi:hypothetical protein